MARKIALISGLLFFVIVAGPVFAQCKDCRVDWQGCLFCHDTTYNAAGLCQLVNNGHTCQMYGECTGWSGEDPCTTGVGQCLPFDQSTRLKPWTTNEWRLASVRVTRKDPPRLQ